jgi:hypothetical protein
MRTAAAVALVLAGLIAAGAAEDPDISNRRAGERTAFSDAEVADGFFKTAFGAELPLGKQLARIARLYGPERALQIQTSLEPQCLSAFRKDEADRIVHSDVILAADTTDFVFYDCAYEEILQALGPINDTDTVPWTMFNDAVHMGFFDVYDQYILNILYDPRIRPGMDADTVRALLPQVLRDVRAWVASVNRLRR